MTHLGLLRYILRFLSDNGRERPYRAAPTLGTREPLVPIIEEATYTRVVASVEVRRPAETLRGRAWVIDGDTIVIEGTKIRLAGIDAPELDHPYGKQAKFAMMALCKGQIVTAHFDGANSHDRCVATCYLPDGRDLSAEMVRIGLAIDWPKHSGGKYRPLELPEVRRRLWRAHNRQTGRFNY